MSRNKGAAQTGDFFRATAEFRGGFLNSKPPGGFPGGISRAFAKFPGIRPLIAPESGNPLVFLRSLRKLGLPGILAQAPPGF